jgi:menaquinol-cytochrome c reductase iron-sulfur subunit
MAQRPGPRPAAGDDPSRRSILGLTGLIAAAIGALTAVPLASVFAGPLLRKGSESEWVPVAPTQEFPDGSRVARTYEYQEQDGWYTATRRNRVMVARKGAEFQVLSLECTHLGCGVQWDEGQQKFLCPCHGAEFGPDGTVLKGPAADPLARFEARQKGAMLEIRPKAAATARAAGCEGCSGCAGREA